jgi:hypothetical protein
LVNRCHPPGSSSSKAGSNRDATAEAGIGVQPKTPPEDKQ